MLRNLLLRAILTLLVPSYRITITKHTNRQTPYILTRTVTGFPSAADDVCGTVVSSISPIHASVTFVPHVVVPPPPVLGTADGFFEYSSFTSNTITSYAVSSTAIDSNTFLLTVSAAGLVPGEGLSYLTNVILVHLHIIFDLCLTIDSISARVMLSL